jgi:hypothetical protein
MLHDAGLCGHCANAGDEPTQDEIERWFYGGTPPPELPAVPPEAAAPAASCSQGAVRYQNCAR